MPSHEDSPTEKRLLVRQAATGKAKMTGSSLAMARCPAAPWTKRSEPLPRSGLAACVSRKSAAAGVLAVSV